MADGVFLVGDIGGTNARFAIAHPDGTLENISILKVADHRNFDVALSQYLDTIDERPATLCVASAGALRGDTVHLTNAPWTLAETALGSQFGFRVVSIINDFQAQARFAGTMRPGSGDVLKEGRAVDGAPVLTVGPGTGFGQALFTPGHPPRVIATEGGHRLLPVRNARELRLFERLTKAFGHQPILEDALSGRGIVNLYHQVLLDDGGEMVPTEPPAVTKAALEGPGHAREAILWFIDLLACAAADACFSTGARGGIAVSGGIMPRFRELLPQAKFAACFARDGILQDYLNEVPVTLVTEPYAALYGAASVMHDRFAA